MWPFLAVAVAVMSPKSISERYVAPGGELVTVTRHPAPVVPGRPARIWSCSGPKFSASTASGPMEEGKVRNFSLGASGIGFSDPMDGNGSGSTQWSGIKLQYAEGDKVDISISCSKMILTFSASDCADGKPTFSRGVRDPWTPPRSSQTFSFTFLPRPGMTRVGFTMLVRPGASQAYGAWSASAGWLFTPGERTPSASSAPELHVSDATKIGGDMSFLASGSAVAESQIGRAFSHAPPCEGVAADGVSMLVVTATSEKPGRVDFSVGGVGGALYQTGGGVSIYKSLGTRTLSVHTRRLSSGKYGALAIYRPPSYFGRGGDSKTITLSVRVGGGPSRTNSVSLVRPPVVLVHGTYDNPYVCYEEHEDEDDAPANLAPLLRSLGYEVSCVDWEDTNGAKDPSDFQTNRMTVWRNKDGLKDAIEKMRRRNIAVTQADVVCHSQGGVITRTYCRGYPFSVSLPPTHRHYTNPYMCRSGGHLCWYHRPDNNFMGDIHRLITISSTHRGSHCCNLFGALSAYPDEDAKSALIKATTNIFLVGVDVGISGITTGGFLNQVPGSLELQLIGPTPVASHAIACVGTDEDMKTTRINHRYGVTAGMGDYYGKLFLVWLGTPDRAKAFAVDHIAAKAKSNGNPSVVAMAGRFKSLLKQNPAAKSEAMDEASLKLRDEMIYELRKIVFEGDENDCTVSLHSSWGGLSAPYVTKCEHIMHGWAPRYRNVQKRVVELLVNDGSLFAADGFPGYSGLRSKASTFEVQIKPLVEGPMPTLPDTAPKKPTAKGGTTRSNPGSGVTKSVQQPTAGAITASDWTSTPSGGTALFESGQLILTSQSTGGTPQATIKFPLAGDFDVAFEFDLSKWPQDSSLKELAMFFRPQANEEADRTVEFRRSTMSGRDSMVVISDEKQPSPIAVSGKSGRMRVRRSGDSWTFSQFVGGQWQSVDTIQAGSTPVYLGFALVGVSHSGSTQVTIRRIGK